MATANALTDPCTYEPSDPPGYRSALADVGKAAGGKALAVKVFELPPGQSVCPYHYEYEEEWAVLLTGSLLLRGPAGEEPLAVGAVVCFPPGPDGAHKLTNHTTSAARVLMFSSAREPAVAVYPDSNKLGVWPGNSEDHVMLHRADGQVDYWEGERP